MQILEIIKISYTSIISNKVRTALTLLGMIIGVMSIMIVFSSGKGLEGLVLDQIASFGTDFIEIEVKIPSGKTGAAADTQSAVAMVQGVQITTLTLDDVDDVNKLPNIITGYGAITGQELASYGAESRKATLFGVSGTYLEIDNSEVASGRFFTEAEDRALAKVVVLGHDIAQKLFGDSDPIDKFVKIKKNKYKVIGVMKEKGAVFTLDFDNYLYLPVRTVQKRILGINHVLYTVHKVRDTSQAENTAEEIRTLLRTNHDITTTEINRDDFRVVTMDEMLDTLNIITGALTLLLSAIVFIALIVGGVGVMNVLYVIISERKMEIGLRKAVGATEKNILYQFLTESIFLTFIAGSFGILFGILISLLISFAANQAGLAWKFSIPVDGLVVSISFSLFFGVIFGILPARKAAKLDPIEAIRGE